MGYRNIVLQGDPLPHITPCELNPDYLPHIGRRMDAEAMPLFAGEANGS